MPRLLGVFVRPEIPSMEEIIFHSVVKYWLFFLSLELYFPRLLSRRLEELVVLHNHYAHTRPRGTVVTVMRIQSA